MTVKRRGNPNWGKPAPYTVAGISSFESVVKTLGLAPRQYADSVSLKDWVVKNKHNKYVPQELLQTWGMASASEV